MMLGVHIKLKISVLADLGADLAISTPMDYTKSRPGWIHDRLFLCCKLCTSKTVAGYHWLFLFAFVSGKKKKKQISQKENPSHSTAPRSDRSVACHVFWCQWSVPGFKFHSFQHQSEVQLHVVSQQNVVFLPTLLRVEAASLGLQNRYLRLCMYIMYIQLLHKGHI